MMRIRKRDVVFWSSCSVLSALAVLGLSLYLDATYIRHLPDAWSPEVIVSINSGSVVVLSKQLRTASLITVFFTAGALICIITHTKTTKTEDK